MLSAKIRSAHSFGFKKGDLVKVTIPADINYAGMETEPEETFIAFLLHPAAKAHKYRWLERKGIAFPRPAFFRQRHWMAIVDDETLLVLEGFMTLEHRND